MRYQKEEIKEVIKKIRNEIGHSESEINIKDIIFNEDTEELWIITPDRPDKSIIIGKGGWVVGRLNEELGLNKIHVESHSDFILKKYRMKLSLNRVNKIIKMQKSEKYEIQGLLNLKKLLELKIDNIYNFNFNEYIDTMKLNDELNIDNNKKHQAIVALSGGVDSSFSLILSKYLGFNPIAITIDPGTIILPKQFKKNINRLYKEIDVKHEYLKMDYEKIIEDSLNGRFHPCGRCSSMTESTLFNYGQKNNIKIVIFGDMLSTGSQCITEHKIANENPNINSEYESNKMYRLNLPATLSTGKQEIKKLTHNFNIEKIKGFGCPLLFEVHKKFPYMRKFSIQRILRETRAGALEPGEALNLIWSFNK